MISFSRLGLVGRLGNALFEMASTVGIADSLGVEPRFNAGWIHRPYFSVPDRLFTDNFDGCTPAEETPLVDHIDPRARVYLQDIGLFSHVLDTVRGYCAPSHTAADILAGPSCADFHKLPRPILAVHVRRGDNVVDPGVPHKHLWYPVPTSRFYELAADSLRSEVASVACFSDDIAWCRDNLKADYFHEGLARPKEHEPDYLSAPVLDWIDFQLIASCERHVVSNSTYSTFAALLSGDDRAVYAWPPYGPKMSYIDASLLYPKAWRRLSIKVR